MVRPATTDGHRAEQPDHRMVVPALTCWAAALVAVGAPSAVGVVLSGALVALLIGAWRTRRLLTGLAAALALGTLLAGTARTVAVSQGPVARAGHDRAVATVRLQVATDPRTVRVPRGDVVVLEARVRRIEVRGRASRVRSPVVVWGDRAWSRLPVGTTVTTRVRAGPADDSSVAASLDAVGRPRVVADPAWWWDGAQVLRDGVTASVQGRGTDVAGLVPALVHGDDAHLPDDLEDAFRTSGLTHLLAVSGTNLTLVVGFLLGLVRAVRAPPRLQLVVGLVGIAGFVVLARPEPSVVRAAAMGAVALVGLGSGGRRRGMRTLAWAVVVLVLLDPWLARTPGFVLSVTATAGILLLAPGWRDALARWMPRTLAEALAVPLAAQLACTPAVAAISGQVSLVAVAANVLAAPAVGPATVLGLLGGAVAVVHRGLGALVGHLTALPAAWICQVGRRGAALPGAGLDWATTATSVVVLAAVCVVLAVVVGPVLRRPVVAAAVAVVLVVVVWRPVAVGWPPAGWVMVACDVGQGDATVLNAGGGVAVVVDAGPDARLVDRCLDRLRVERVAAVLLTHAHADHVDGLRGVARGRPVDVVGVGPSGGPRLAGVPERQVLDGSRGGTGDVRWEVLGPASSRPVTASGGEGDDEGAMNDASLVLRVEVRGARLLLTGDVEPDGQAALLRDHPDPRTWRVDVLKVPHHGSGRQDRRFLAATGARLATVSAGADNTYGHPAPRLLRTVRELGMRVLRTDVQGDLAVVVRDGEVGAVVQH